jgi:hypothetical protein
MGYSEFPARCAECARLIAERQEREQVYLAALGKLTRATGGNREYMALRALVDDAEIDLDLVGAKISQHRHRHALPN